MGHNSDKGNELRDSAARRKKDIEHSPAEILLFDCYMIRNTMPEHVGGLVEIQNAKERLELLRKKIDELKKLVLSDSESLKLDTYEKFCGNYEHELQALEVQTKSYYIMGVVFMVIIAVGITYAIWGR